MAKTECGRTGCRAARAWQCLLCAWVLGGVLSSFGTGVEAQPRPWAKVGYDAAVSAFRQGRFGEAYGRFVELAESGDGAAARHALWMCENGMELFGRPWDCAPHEVEAWARLSGANPADALRRIYPGYAVDAARAARRR